VSIERKLYWIAVVSLLVFLGSIGVYEIAFSVTEPEVAEGQSADATVVTTSNGQLVVAQNGVVKQVYEDYDKYWDIDPVTGTRRTVTYTATSDSDACGNCIRQYLVRHNLTTDVRTTLYSRVTPQGHNSEWHDADRVGDHQYVVTDMQREGFFVVNTRANQIAYRWDLQQVKSVDTGGPYPQDWSHLNDVEITERGVMLSLRNHDQIVWVDPSTGRVTDTLGADGKHEKLFEQHNPDYIPKERGGPAVVVADSENDRIVEYEERDGKWVRTWTWRDSELTWPRDADRLPSGNTLVTDTRGGRVIEVDDEGDIVYELEVYSPFEAERLGTGDESAGGKPASDLRYDDRVAEYSLLNQHLDRSKVSALEAIAPLVVQVAAIGALVVMVLSMLGNAYLVYVRDE